MPHRRSPSFFKILLDASAPHLPLPPDFVSRHLENKIPKDPIIRSATGGYSWRLKIIKIGESYCFSSGWSNVVTDAQLGFGDFLVFRFDEKSSFRLCLYSPNGCEKDFPQKIDNDSGIVDDDVVVEDVGDDEEEEYEVEVEDEDEDDEEEEEYQEEYHEEKDDGDDDEDEDEDDGDDEGGGDIDGDDGDPFFMSIISQTHKNELRLPPEFVKLAGIVGDGTLTLKNLDGKEWQTELRLEKRNQSERYCISAGWSDFRRGNDLSDGDECIFKFIRSEDKLLLARVTKKRRPVKRPQQSGEAPATEVVKKKREQPEQNPGEVPAVGKRERVMRTRGQGGGVEVVKRSRGKPAMRRRGKPTRRK